MEIKRSDPDDTVFVTIYLDSIKNSFSVSNIYYDYDKATLRPESVQSLDSVVHFLTDNPSITVEIYSYTDAKGRDEYNMALSQRRAQSVMDYLEKNGWEVVKNKEYIFMVTVYVAMSITQKRLIRTNPNLFLKNIILKNF